MNYQGQPRETNIQMLEDTIFPTTKISSTLTSYDFL